MALSKSCRLIRLEKWNIIYTFRSDRQGKPRMLKKEFDNPKQAKYNLDMYFRGNLRFDIIRGDEAIELKLQVMKAFPNLHIYLRKYRYENHMIAEQDKKSYRTKFRRQNRTKKGELYRKWG